MTANTHAPAPNVEVPREKRPIAIYHKGDAASFYASMPETQAAWNAYAQAEANKFNTSGELDSYDSTNTVTGINRDGKITGWCPPMFFPEWLAAQSPAPASNVVGYNEVGYNEVRYNEVYKTLNEWRREHELHGIDMVPLARQLTALISSASKSDLETKL